MLLSRLAPQERDDVRPVSHLSSVVSSQTTLVLLSAPE